MHQSNPFYLNDIPAVPFVETPAAAVVAVRDVVAADVLGLEELSGSLSGHLADDHRPLKVDLLKKFHV